MGDKPGCETDETTMEGWVPKDTKVLTKVIKVNSEPGGINLSQTKGVTSAKKRHAKQLRPSPVHMAWWTFGAQTLDPTP